MWDLPGPGIKPMSPALAGGFLSTAPPGKSLSTLHLTVVSLQSPLIYNSSSAFLYKYLPFFIFIFLKNSSSCFGKYSSVWVWVFLQWSSYLQSFSFPVYFLHCSGVSLVFFFNYYYFLNWCIVDLQCCVNLCCTAQWFNYTHIYILFLFNILFHYGLITGYWI